MADRKRKERSYAGRVGAGSAPCIERKAKSGLTLGRSQIKPSNQKIKPASNCENQRKAEGF
jgi:hypothetical protein